MEFQKLEKGKDSVIESKISDYWDSINILNRSIETRNNGKKWVFYDGPIYANAKPGIHHVFAKTIKDAFCKYKTMNGYRVERKIGLDTHGLPIEVNVEKKLGFKGKSDIEKFGIENFCRECNKATLTNTSEVDRVTRMMGQFIDTKNPYITCSNDYIESEWWILKEMDKKGLLYHSNKVLPYCPRCGTELSQNEVAQEYHEDTVNTVYVPFKIKEKDEYFLVWTTTPWTLIANLALCVNPDMDYALVESQGNKFILAKDLVGSLFDDYKIIKEMKGDSLVGTEYEQLMPFVKVSGKAFTVVADSYVTNADGTGVVHIAPAYGEDDARVCKENGITFVNPVGKDGCYTEGPWKGSLVTSPDLEIEIIKWLKENGKLFRKQKLKHNYPHCWRCKSPLIYYAKPAWYIKTTAYKDKIIEANKKVNWYPSFVGEKRFANWLENMVDWGISRNRYWGCPMPIWTCDCGERVVIGSREELQEKIVEDVDVSKLELHRPYVDNLHIKCPKCGKLMNRVPDVLDVWFDSGSMPYAQWHYPFENKEKFKDQFPADFIAEGVDQTRGWFYVLIVISTILSGESSFKNVVVNDMMLDKNGKKMSKSIGNIIDPVEIMTKYGADTIRFYMMYVSPVWTPLKFSEEGVKEVYSKYTSTMKNLYSFFEMYANADHIDPREYDVKIENRELIDKWLLSKLNKLIKNVREAYDEFDLNKVARLVVPFINDDFSNWYIRSTRRRFWDSELTLSKKAVYKTTYEVLLALVKICAPLTPFVTEEIYRKLTGEESVHLESFPEYNEELVNDEAEERMDLVREVCSLGRNARETAEIKVRQPIKTLILPYGNKAIIGDLLPIIKEELNVKEVEFVKDMDKYLEYSVKPNFKEVGKILGPRVSLFKEYLENISKEDIEKLKEGELHISLGGDSYTITPSMVLIDLKEKEGFASKTSNMTSVVLDTNLTDDLILEGLAREFVRTVQALRKEKDLVITDHINIYYDGDKDLDRMLSEFDSYVKGETLANDIVSKKTSKEYELNGHKCSIDIEKI